jgi:hypothetical protein
MMRYKRFLYGVRGWSTTRRLVEKVEFHAGKLFLVNQTEPVSGTATLARRPPTSLPI